MKKNVLALRVMICLWFMTSTMPSWSQTISEYEFNAYAGTFTPIVNGIAPPLSGSTDNGAYQGIPIGFTFPFSGSNYTTVAASVNGFVRLGFDINLGELTQNNLLATNSVTGVLLAPLWDDLSIVNGTFHYRTTGVAPNRVLTLQWLNMNWRANSPSAGISFQVKLYETSGKIEYIYRQEAGAVTGSASIGIRGSGSGAHNFLSLVSSSPKPRVWSNIETSSISFKPLTGQMYVFEPDGIPLAPILRTNGTTLDLGYGNVPFTLEQKIGENGTYQTLTTTTSNTYTIGSSGEVRFYRIKKGNSAYSPELRMDPWRLNHYGFKATQGSFVPLTGAVVPVAQNSMYHHIPIGFPFRYPLSTFTTVSVNDLGEVFLGTDARGYFYDDPLIDDELPKLSPLGGQRLTTGTFSYKTTGVSPNKVFTMEWLNVEWNADAILPVISFQVKLYESTGKIEYIYRQESGNVSTGGNGAVIGLRASKPGSSYGEVLSLKSATADPGLSASNGIKISYKPFTGQVYTFEPNGIPVAPRVEKMGTTAMFLNVGSIGNNFIVEEKVGETGSWTTISTSSGGSMWVMFHSDEVHFYRVKKGSDLPYSPELRVNPTSFQQYTFESSSGTFTALQNASIASAQSINNIRYFNHIPIGFEFPYNGVWFNKVSINDRGQLVFNRDGALVWTDQPFSTFSDAMLAPLSDQIHISSVSYRTEGVAPSRIFTLECKNTRWNFLATNPGISFQVKLYENTGKVQFVYRPESGDLYNAQGLVGIRGIGDIANYYFTLNSLGPQPQILWDTENSSLNAKPVNGQTYTFMIPNTAPQAYDTVITIQEDQSVTGFMRAKDADGNTLQYTITQENSALHTLSGAMPNLTYTPLAEYSGTDTIKFKVSDGIAESAEATIVFVITPVNDAPVSSDEWINMIQNTVYTFSPADFTFNDVEGHAWTGMRIVSVETVGDLEYNNTDVVANGEYAYPTGTLVFKPVPGTSGVPYASFTFQLKDSQGAWSSVYTMGINVHCAPPINATASSITATSALISWEDPNNTGTYEVMYRPTGNTSWSKVSTNQLSQVISGLTSYVEYEYRVRAICSGDVYSIGEPVHTFVTVVNYIDLVNLGTINNTSGQSTYTFYSNLFTTVTPSNTHTLQYSGAGSGVKKYYKAWIDYNLDGYFESPQEVILSAYTSTQTTLSQAFVVPAWASFGISRLRVAVSYYPISEASTLIPTGEVEDYTIYIDDPYGGGSSFRSSTPVTVPEPAEAENGAVEIFPNPADDHLILNAPVIFQSGDMVITAANGALLYQGKFKNQVDVSAWKPGLYLIRLLSQGQINTLKFIKK